MCIEKNWRKAITIVAFFQRKRPTRKHNKEALYYSKLPNFASLRTPNWKSQRNLERQLLVGCCSRILFHKAPIKRFLFSQCNCFMRFSSVNTTLLILLIRVRMFKTCRVLNMFETWQKPSFCLVVFIQVIDIFTILKSQVILGHLPEESRKLPIRFLFLFQVRQSWN